MFLQFLQHLIVMSVWPLDHYCQPRKCFSCRYIFTLTFSTNFTIDLNLAESRLSFTWIVSQLVLGRGHSSGRTFVVEVDGALPDVRGPVPAGGQDEFFVRMKPDRVHGTGVTGVLEQRTTWCAMFKINWNFNFKLFLWFIENGLITYLLTPKWTS